RAQEAEQLTAWRPREYPMANSGQGRIQRRQAAILAAGMKRRSSSHLSAVRPRGRLLPVRSRPRQAKSHETAYQLLAHVGAVSTTAWRSRLHRRHGVPLREADEKSVPESP